MKIIELKSKNNSFDNKNINNIFSNKKGYDNNMLSNNQEWYNSTYNYNVNYTKHLPVIDNVIFKLVKSYFTIYSKIMDKRVKIKNISNFKRRLSGNKIWVSRPEIKHTNDKIIINLFIFNRKNNLLIKKLNNNLRNLFVEKRVYIKNIILKNKENSNIFVYIMNFYKKNMKYLNNRLNKFLNESNITLKENMQLYILKEYYIKLIKKILKKELLIIYYKQQIEFNTLKYKNVFIIPILKLIKKIYKKNVVFNIISLKNYFLNSSILTQIVSVKAKNRKNKIVRILRAALRKVKTPSFNKNLIEREKRKLEIENNFLLKNKAELEFKNDNINKTLSSIFKKDNVESDILDSVKNKVVTGIRLEASGRLTKRFTAQRSVHKYKYKGTIKNINTSYKGISSKNLRNNLESNLQYTKINSSNRIGAFGIKGWISSI
jgi:hypothetical protein